MSLNVEFAIADWRTPIKTSIILQRLQNKLIELDSQRQVQIVCSTSKAKSFLQAEASGKKSSMILQEKTWTTKRFDRSGADRVYCARFFKIATYVAKRLDVKKQEMNRACGYQLKSREWRQDNITKMFRDMALSIDVHPVYLGVVPESKGRVWIPNGIDIATEVVHHIFEFADNAKQKVTKRLVGGAEYEIPKLVFSMKIAKPPGTEIRAVIVCEHRSLRDQFEQMETKKVKFMNGLLVVMTGGFADTATREFLCLLEKDSDLTNTPFLFLSDCDPHALTIFTNLKFGSIEHAYESPSTTCSRLRWCGLTIQQYEEVAKKWVEKQLRDNKRKKSLSEQEENKLREKEEARLQRDLKKLRNNKARICRGADVKRIDHLRRYKLLEGPEEALALKTLRALEGGRPMMSVFDLDRFHIFGVFTWIRDVVAEWNGEQDEMLEHGIEPVLSQDFMRKEWNSVSDTQITVSMSQKRASITVEDTEELAAYTLDSAYDV